MIASVGWGALPHPTITTTVQIWSLRVTLSLAKPGDIIIRPRPVGWILPPRDCSLERGIRPIDRPGDKPVFDRIEMDIIDVSSKIVWITHRMLPKSALPNPTLSLGSPGP